MKDFGRWYEEQVLPTPPAAPSVEDQLEALGLDLMKDGSVWGKCRACDRRICWTEMLSTEEILRDGVGEEYCGSSPRCLP